MHYPLWIFTRYHLSTLQCIANLVDFFSKNMIKTVIVVFLYCCLFSTPRYRKIWQYVDQTIAYFAQLEGTYYGRGCGFIKDTQSLPDYMLRTLSANLTCVDKLYARFLCEAKTRVPVIPQTTELPPPPTPGSYKLKMIACAGGHLTHEFLACDVQSACQARDASASTSCVARGDDTAGVCRTALTPLPPSVPCGNGRGEVPYTLVCDHRPDCSDDSDESFCVFSPCDAVTQFDCGNRQVGS